MTFLERLENSAFSQWVLGSDSLLAYPTILTLHTVGLAIVVGAAIVVCLKLIGVGAAIPPATMRTTFKLFWVGFVVNLISGVILLVAEATQKATMPMFLIKLTFITFGIVLIVASRRRVLTPQTTPSSGADRAIGIVGLMLWTAAIIAGRLMAYV